MSFQSLSFKVWNINQQFWELVRNAYSWAPVESDSAFEQNPQVIHMHTKEERQNLADIHVFQSWPDPRNQMCIYTDNLGSKEARAKLRPDTQRVCQIQPLKQCSSKMLASRSQMIAQILNHNRFFFSVMFWFSSRWLPEREPSNVYYESTLKRGWILEFEPSTLEFSSYFSDNLNPDSKLRLCLPKSFGPDRLILDENGLLWSICRGCIQPNYFCRQVATCLPELNFMLVSNIRDVAMASEGKSPPDGESKTDRNEGSPKENYEEGRAYFQTLPPFRARSSLNNLPLSTIHSSLNLFSSFSKASFKVLGQFSLSDLRRHSTIFSAPAIDPLLEQT